MNSIFDFKETLNLSDNPIENPPLEILKQGNEAVLHYFEELEKQGSAYLYEAKMLVVGEGGVGKTSLVKKLKDKDAELPKEAETTKGIDIHELKFICKDENEFMTRPKISLQF